MKKFVPNVKTAGLFLLTLFILSGPAWSQNQTGQAGIAAYLKQIDTIEANLTVIATDMQKSTANLAAMIRDGSFDPKVVNAKIAGVRDRIVGEQNKLRLLSGPEATKGHQYYMDQQITATIKMMDQLPPMLTRTRKVLDLSAQKASDDPAREEQLAAAIKTEQDAIVGHQTSVKALTAELSEISKSVDAERKKLDNMVATK